MTSKKNDVPQAAVPKNTTEKVAFLGMGIMGGAMAANIAKSGMDVTVFNRTAGRPGIKLAHTAGAHVATTVQQAVKEVALIALCLGDENSVEEILLNKGGVVDYCVRGATIIDFTTIGPKAAKSIGVRLREQGIQYIDAPVTGGQPGAENGTLTIMAGATENISPSVQKLLDAVGSKTVFCGECGSGSALKLINQALCVTNLVGVGEALQLGDAFGVSPEKIVAACSGGAAGSWQLANLALRGAQGDFAPGFRVEHMRKDLRLLNDAGGTHVGPVVQHGRTQFEELAAQSTENNALGTQAILKLYTSTKA